MVHYIDLVQQLRREAISLPEAVNTGYQEAYLRGWTSGLIIDVLD